VLEVFGLKKSFGSFQAVNGVSFSVPKGGKLGLLGPNGAGKTTTISMICGALHADSGHILLNGAQISPETHALRKDIGYVPQEVALIMELSCADNLRFFGSLYDLPAPELKSRIDWALQIVGLTDKKDQVVRTYSGGMMRRANLAAAILHRPALLVLDEPTVGVDPQSRNALFDAIEGLCREGMTLIYTSHYMEEVERLCDDIVIMDHGKVIVQGPPNKILELARGERRVKLSFDPPYEGATERDYELADLGPSLAALLNDLAQKGATVTAVQTSGATLEQAFLNLTGRELRD
jgi:ABC-2 type transport system ATP-binding protein